MCVGLQVGHVGPRGNTPKLPMAKTARGRGPHLSELLASLLAGRVALNSSGPPNQG